MESAVTSAVLKRCARRPATCSSSPGAGEIRRVGRCSTRDLGGADRRTAVRRAGAGRSDRALFPARVGAGASFATSIAETSLTIAGGASSWTGWSRRPRFRRPPATRLRRFACRGHRPISAGRAGRLGPGVCYRLWPGAEMHGRSPARRPRSRARISRRSRSTWPRREWPIRSSSRGSTRRPRRPSRRRASSSLSSRHSTPAARSRRTAGRWRGCRPIRDFRICSFTHAHLAN